MRNEIKRLYRVPGEGKIAGVCAGLGEYFRVDPVFFRIGWVAITVMTGVLPGALAYLVAWFLVPQESLLHPTGQAEGLDGTRA